MQSRECYCYFKKVIDVWTFQVKVMNSLGISVPITQSVARFWDFIRFHWSFWMMSLCPQRWYPLIESKRILGENIFIFVGSTVPADGLALCCTILGHVQTQWWPNLHSIYTYICRAESRLGPSQWETSLQSNTVSHWLGANLESALIWDHYLKC